MTDTTVTNELGGVQSDIGVRFDLGVPWVMIEFAQVLHQAAEKYGETNWQKITLNENINHAINHLYRALRDGGAEDDLVHAMVRCMMARAVTRLEGEARR